MLETITLDQLRIFVAVAEDGSFSAAGRRLGRVQSAVSQAMLNLELSLEVQLFLRATKSPTLSDAGRALLVRARQVLEEMTALRAQAASLSMGLEAELTLAVDNLFPVDPILAGLTALRAQYPDLPVTLYTAPIFAAGRRVQTGAADIALCSLQPVEFPELAAQSLTEIPMIAVAAPMHPLAMQRGKLSREMLSRHVQLVLTDPSSAPVSRSFGIVGSRVWRFVDLSWRLKFLHAGFGWCNMPSHLVASLISSGELIELKLEEPSLLPQAIPIYAVYLRTRPPGPAGRWLLEHLTAAFLSNVGNKKDMPGRVAGTLRAPGTLRARGPRKPRAPGGSFIL